MALKRKKELISELIDGKTNVDFQVTWKKYLKQWQNNNFVILQPHPKSENQLLTQKSSNKITPTTLDVTESKTRVTKIVEITDIPKVSNVYLTIKKIIEILYIPELHVNIKQIKL